ncbi:hypothetical protein Y032_0002g1082 [Ancylostoma ceylanicum]|uniref:Uncharacterized protein n=1 Tax=Ancylostoma ceylanicum TaxID=53326 RepID=A0A016VZC0_9BILA|nr:hypothetical protein Y032_0002g1082 [Ancylostoma ceylanicum]
MSRAQGNFFLFCPKPLPKPVFVSILLGDHGLYWCIWRHRKSASNVSCEFSSICKSPGCVCERKIEQVQLYQARST